MNITAAQKTDGPHLCASVWIVCYCVYVAVHCDWRRCLAVLPGGNLTPGALWSCSNSVVCVCIEKGMLSRSVNNVETYVLFLNRHEWIRKHTAWIYVLNTARIYFENGTACLCFLSAA